MKILVLDNYDSFVYNLVHIVRELGYADHTAVHRNDKISLDEVDQYDKILLSPGPGIPSEAGIMLDLIRRYGASKSILGVCLGHQAIGEVYGAELYNMKEVLHGVGTPVEITDANAYIFADMPARFRCCRYHSWAVVAHTVQNELQVTAKDDEGVVMGLTHAVHDVNGVQFHPESILTEHGKKIIENWLNHTAPVAEDRSHR
jgi:anthranilate synthase component 2